MADNVNYPHCDTCGRVFATAKLADQCQHNGPEPNITKVFAARLAGERNEDHQYIARLQGRIK